jgi:hypothetical protein
MFRDDAQAVRALRLLLSGAGLDALWTDAGPAPALLSRQEDTLDLAPEKRAVLLAAWSLWSPVTPGISLGEVVRSLDAASCSSLCALIVAYKRGGEAVDAWIADASSGSPRAGEIPARHGAPHPDAWAPGMSIWADWPTLDAMSLRYVLRVLDHAKNSTRAATLLDIDRRTVTRLVAAARKGVVPVIQTQQRRANGRARRG